MKTRARERQGAKNQQQPGSHVQHNGSSGEEACVGQSLVKSSEKRSDSSVFSERRSITKTSVLAESIHLQNITSTSQTDSSLVAQNIPSTMAESLSSSLKLVSTPSAAERSVCGGFAQTTQSSSTQSRQTSPVQLTELVSSTLSKTDCLPSDKNHNLPPMYVTSSQLTQGPIPNQYSAYPESKVSSYSDLSAVNSAGFTTNYYYSSHEGKKMDVTSSTHYSISPPESCVYPKDNVYPSQYLFDSQACKAFSFVSIDSGREYSPPEMTAGHTSTCYTSLLTTSLTSGASPDSVHWSPESSHVLPSDACLPGSSAAVQSALPLQEAVPNSGKPVTEARSSLHSAYYSDDQSLGEDSMQDIKHDILTSDIHKHIYQNFSQNLALSLDEESADNFEDDSSEQGGASGKTGTSSKKRRRRTQTPVQRTAANMRERKRMCHLNTAFNYLKDRLPNVRNRKKLSRIQTLKAAIFYIGLLTECLQTS
ncbi:hypothetical protein ACOMHN_046246 [Nucella lapillus]